MPMGPEERAAPALADALVVAAAVWTELLSGHSLDRALASTLAHSGHGSPRGAAPPPALADDRMPGAVRDIAAHAVRRNFRLEFILGQLVHRPPDPAVRALLTVALAQLMARSYADFTVVDQAVHAARARPATAGAAGFVNAVLREFLRRRSALEEAADRDPARRCNLPPWWWRQLQAEYGPRAEALALAQLEEPPLVLRVNRRRATVAAVLDRFAAEGLDATRVGAAAVWLRRAIPVERIPGFADGLVSVQDAGAQLAAPWLGATGGMRVLDACAAPGGKTAHLLELADCRVDAVEHDADRARRIESNLQRVGLSGSSGARSARVVVADLLQPARYWDGTPYDRILLDAPCSASGVVRRHPDVVMLRRAADVANLATQQAKMLRTLWPLLAPAGRLLYVVCSVFAEEGRRQVSGFVRRQPGARLIELVPGMPSGVQLLPNGLATAGRTMTTAEPDDGNAPAMPLLHDGFFYALLEKT
jgi:16S rRNA (cytosine967-C5)-methyltransferase